MPTAGIIFDLDGVIIDSEGLQYRAYCRVLEPFGVRISRAEYGREWIAAGRGPDYAVHTYHLPISPRELKERKHPVYQQLLRAEVSLMPGARDALARLSPCFPLALATNSLRSEVTYVLERFGLGPFFQSTVAREDYRDPKPLPDAFVAAAAALGLPPARCVVIEDAHKGVVAAARAACKCIAVPCDFTRDNDFRLAALVVPSLDAVTPDVIEHVLENSAPPD